ncbi:MAG: TatD family hydrolase [Bacteroidetes bacterium]|nr:TatD family hydrolase [Bacteroidota bacterium]
MSLIDTHAHLYADKYAQDRDAMIARARVHCSHLLLPNIDEASIAPLHALAAAYPGYCLPMMGLHPCYVPEDYTPVLERMAALLDTGQYIGVGETGLDLYWDKSTLPRQQESLRVHIRWARDYDLPLILHTRNATQEVIAELEAAQDGRLRGICHCFSDGPEEAARITDLGFHLGIGGVITYKNNGLLPDAVRSVDPRWLVLETDAPYLAPVPHRGQRNESAYLIHIAGRLAQELDMSSDELAALTTRNAKALFRLN